MPIIANILMVNVVAVSLGVSDICPPFPAFLVEFKFNFKFKGKINLKCCDFAVGRQLDLDIP